MYSPKEQKTYWEERASKLGKTAVGYADQNIVTQDKLYKERMDFIFKYVDRELATIDYGCGIGRYTPEFTRSYIGLDMTKNLLDIAKEANPKAKYRLIQDVIPIEEDFLALGGELRQFFTATVLQHCSAVVVTNILKRLSNTGFENFTFCFYENSMPFVKNHVAGRFPESYNKFVREAGFKIEKWDFHTHTVKGEDHSLTRIKVA